MLQYYREDLSVTVLQGGPESVTVIQGGPDSATVLQGGPDSGTVLQEDLTLLQYYRRT